MTERTIALVTGANRGIGRAIAHALASKGFMVMVASREPSKAAAVVDRILASGGAAESLALDVGDPESIRRAADAVNARHSHLDVLVNNAGVMVGMADTILTASRADIDHSLDTNVFGSLELVKALLPLLKRSKAPRVVNLSSTAGSLTDITDPGSPYAAFETASYRLSKAALNAVTTLLAKALRADGVLINAMCPGWVRTDMGGPDAPRTPEEAADTAVWLATLPPDGPSGGFFADRSRIPW